MALFGSSKRAAGGINVSGSFGTNVVAGSPGASQDVEQAIFYDNHSGRDHQITGFASKLRTHLRDVNPEADAEAIADAIEEAVRAKDVTKLRVALSSAQTAIAVAVGTAVGDDLWKALKPLLQIVGLS